MYSFAQHPLVEECVLDEPFYAHYLQCTGVQRPYTDLVMASQSSDPNEIISDLIERKADEAKSMGHVLFIKHIGKQIKGLSDEAMERLITNNNQPSTVRHFILLRRPDKVLRSFHRVLGMAGATVEETGLKELAEVYSACQRFTGIPPTILSSERLQADPSAQLESLCDALGLPWSERMLSWPSGPKQYDGVWAPWYDMCYVV